MANRVMMLNKKTGVLKKGYFGFSWTYLFFGFWVPLIRGEIFISLIHMIFTIMSLGIWQIIMAFLYNRQFMIRILEKGYDFYDNETIVKRAQQKLGVVNINNIES